MGKEMKDSDRITRLERRVKKLEKIVSDFMNKWGPDVQRRRAQRDEIWDEMVRVVSIQKKNQN
tara:strand:- start:728 stop:916 length:189 start_codon:yes stop_codon:yes gene_type:complete